MAFRRFTIGWRRKALAFWAFDRLPLGRTMYYEVQKRITKTVPRVLAPTAATAQRFIEHYRAIQQNFDGQFGTARFMEFGSGWDLYGTLVFWCFGIDRQLAFDLHRWAKPDQINIVIRHLADDPPAGALRVPRQTVSERGDWEQELRDAYGIDYRAPADAGATGLPDGSIDVITTTSVLEHVPEAQIRRLLAECRRVMHAASVMSHVIDYSDHYSHSDPAITPYNFLRFSEREWRRFNPDLHFQNRLRHADHRRLFEECGFRIVAESKAPPERAAELIAAVPLAEPFSRRPIDDLVPVVGHYVLKRA